jgi:DNA-binding transcriptional LysR family regulator
MPPWPAAWPAEAALQAPLFDRRADGYVPTARGRRVEQLARTMEEAAQASADMAGVDAGLSGLVRLTMAGSMAERFVTDRLGDFHKQHPGIDLEIVVESRVISLSRREADIAVRFGRQRTAICWRGGCRVSLFRSMPRAVTRRPWAKIHRPP